MSTERLRIIVTGLIGQYPSGGVAWDYLQYPIGLARLGHDVYYIEDTGQWPYDPVAGRIAENGDGPARHLATVMARFGLGDRWAYRFGFATWCGMTDLRRTSVVASADLLINVSFSLGRPHEYRAVRRLVCIDSDPVFTQVKLARGQADFRAIVDRHDVRFSFGERLGDGVPDTGHHWHPTRQPIVLQEWTADPAVPTRDRVFTTVMNWSSYKPVTYQGRTYGQKDVEFPAYVDLPQRVAPAVLELAVNAEGKTSTTPIDLLTSHHWRVVDPLDVCPDVDSYRRYIQSSHGEWSVAKHGYVVGQPGWFSCRSACYLAAGKPVVVQDTGFSSVLPAGEGLLAFTDIDGATAAIDAVVSNYPKHAAAARALAGEYFDYGKVLPRLIETAMTSRD